MPNYKTYKKSKRSSHSKTFKMKGGDVNDILNGSDKQKIIDNSMSQHEVNKKFLEAIIVADKMAFAHYKELYKKIDVTIEEIMEIITTINERVWAK